MKLWLEEEKKTYTASEDFKSNQEDGFRYVDKTEPLIPLLNREHETTFFLRLCRFGNGMKRTCFGISSVKDGGTADG